MRNHRIYASYKYEYNNIWPSAHCLEQITRNERKQKLLLFFWEHALKMIIITWLKCDDNKYLSREIKIKIIFRWKTDFVCMSIWCIGCAVKIFYQESLHRLIFINANGDPIEYYIHGSSKKWFVLNFICSFIRIKLSLIFVMAIKYINWSLSHVN